MLGVLAVAPLWSACRKQAAPRADGSALRVPSGVLVAHALGRVDGVDYTNSLEALRCNHRRNFRWFEVDLALTQDAELVAFHTQHEKSAGLGRPIHQLPLSALRGARYREKYPIVTFADVLGEARALGDVVLVTDTKTWPAPMLQAVARVVTAAPQPGPRIVLQAYSDKHIAAVAELAKKIGGGVIFTLYKTRASDEAVVGLAKQYGVLAIVASQQRFNPWLAQRLDAVDVPLLVHTVNEHDQIVKFTRAGADGFYTDSYVAYEQMTAQRQTLFECGAAQPSAAQLSAWLRRDMHNPGDFRLESCAQRRRGRIELGGCSGEAAITGTALALPAQSRAHIELEVEAPASDVDFWFQVNAKGRAKRPREQQHLAAGERRTFSWDVVLANGSPGLETRLGLASREARLDVIRFETTVRPGGVSPEAVLVGGNAGGR